MIRRLATHTLVLMAAPAIVIAAAQADSVQRSFRGHAVHLDLSAGNYRITPSADGRIRITPVARTEAVSTRITVNLLGTRATVRMVGPKDGFDAQIELPARVSVSVQGVPAFQWTGQGAHDLRVPKEQESHDAGKK